MAHSRAATGEVGVTADDTVHERDTLTLRLQQTDGNLRRVIDTAADAYVAVDRDGLVSEWNLAATSIFGWTRGEAVGRSLSELIVPTDLAKANTSGYARYLATGEPTILGKLTQVSARHRSGRIFPVEIALWEVETGGSTGFHAFLRDLTERTRAEDLLRQTNEDLQAFAAMAAHDLRSPLDVVRMYAELMLQELEEEAFDPKTASERITRIGRAADRGVALIEDLLAYASIGRGALEISLVDLAVLAQHVAAEHELNSDRVGYVQVGDLPGVEGSLPLLRQLLSNLIGNAVKYGPSDRDVHVVVDFVPGPAPDRIVLRVTDNGQPIPAEDRGHVFAMFARGANRGATPGTGVGLAICQRVADAHGGSIALDPDFLDGNRFCVELPMHHTPAARG